MQFFLVLVSVVLAAGIAFAIVVLVTGRDPGLAGPDRQPVALPVDRPLSETDISATRFDTGARGYRTTQVDEVLARVAYDVGFKDELIKVLAGEVAALRDGRLAEADKLRQVRRRALGDEPAGTAEGVPGGDRIDTDPVDEEPSREERADADRVDEGTGRNDSEETR